MTHAHDRTLLASLGFQDTDKKDRRHDLACQYLALPESHDRIARSLLEPGCAFQKMNFAPILGKPRFEVQVLKGDGRYRTTIGFLDMVLPFRFTQHHSFIAAIEVKITPTGVGDILRQIAVYREYTDVVPKDPLYGHWLVATAFQMSKGDVAILTTENIRHIRLGEKFERWTSAQITAPEVSNDTEEI